METYATKLWHNNWHILIEDFDNGSACVYFVGNKSKKAFAAIYVDDYDSGESKQWLELSADIKDLPHSISDCKEELEHWENGWDNHSPIDTAHTDFWSDIVDKYDLDDDFILPEQSGGRK